MTFAVEIFGILLLHSHVCLLNNVFLDEHFLVRVLHHELKNKKAKAIPL